MTRGLSLSIVGLLMTAWVADLQAADPPKSVERKPIGSNNVSANVNRTPTLPRRSINTPPNNTQKLDTTAKTLPRQNLNSVGNNNNNNNNNNNSNSNNNNNNNKLDWSYPRGYTPRKGNVDNKVTVQPKVITKDLPNRNINTPNNNLNGGGDFKHNPGHQMNGKPFIEVNPALKGTSHQDWARRQNPHDSNQIRRNVDWNNKGFNGRLDRHWNANDRQKLAYDVRGRMRPHSYFRPDWRPYQHHWHGDDHWRRYWSWNGWRPYYWWRRPTWTFFTGWYGPSWGTYIPYDYGDTIVYQNNYVYMNGQQVAPADVYAQQAINLASVEVPAPAQLPAEGADPIGQWQPLGAFALVNGPNDDPNTFLQIAVSKEGFIAGTYYNRNSEELLPIQGSVDRRTQRAAWRVGEDKETVMEAGIYNLTQDQAPLLIHFGPDRTENYLLVRMEQPRQGESSGTPSFLDESR